MKKNICLIMSAVLFVLIGISEVSLLANGRRSGRGRRTWNGYRLKGRGYRGRQYVSAQYEVLRKWVEDQLAAGNKSYSVAQLKKMFDADTKKKAAWKKLALQRAKKFRDDQAKKVIDALEKAEAAKGSPLTAAEKKKTASDALNTKEAGDIRSPRGRRFCRRVWREEIPVEVQAAIAGRAWCPRRGRGQGGGRQGRDSRKGGGGNRKGGGNRRR